MAAELTIAADVVRPSTPRALFTLPIIENSWSPYDTTDGQRFRGGAPASLASADGNRQLAGATEERVCCVMKPGERLGPETKYWPFDPKTKTRHLPDSPLPAAV
jgi:hypothetical protein